MEEERWDIEPTSPQQRRLRSHLTKGRIVAAAAGALFIWLVLSPTSGGTLTDRLQGWGTVAAVVVAMYSMWRTNQDAADDRKRADDQHLQDQLDADRRLTDERAAADQRLRQERAAATKRMWEEIRQQRKREERSFHIHQLQRAADAYAAYCGVKDYEPGAPSAKVAAQSHLYGALAVLPAGTATLLKAKASKILGEKFGDAATDLSVGEDQRIAQDLLRSRGLDVQGITDFMIYQELAENFRDHVPVVAE